jgi:hypothetical protein
MPSLEDEKVRFRIFIGEREGVGCWTATVAIAIFFGAERRV